MSYLTTIRYNIFPCSKAQLIVIKNQSITAIHTKRYPSGQIPPAAGAIFPRTRLLNVPIPPVTGGILSPKASPATQNIQSLEETGQSTAFQQTNPSSHWKNHPAHRPLSVLILPASGRIGTRRAIETQPARELHMA